jgi:quercetin dioxygenase-like cupin family protein
MKKGMGTPSQREALFGGTGEVLVWDLLGPASLPPFTAVLACELAPGGRVGAHRQEHFPEIVIITEGTGTAVVEGESYALAMGSVIALPLGESLSIANESNEAPLRYLIIKAEQP